MKYILTILFGLCLLAPTAGAKAATEDQMINAIINKVFTETEKRLINNYYGHDKKPLQYKGHAKGKKDGLPHGLAKKDALPPGLAKQLAENGTLPPGLAKRDLPDDLQSRLPTRKGAKRVIVDNDILLVEEGTELVLDILENVLSDKD